MTNQVMQHMVMVNAVLNRNKQTDKKNVLEGPIPTESFLREYKEGRTYTHIGILTQTIYEI